MIPWPVLLLYLYGALLFIGGVMGYVKAKSVPSVVSGVICGLIALFLGANYTWHDAPYAALALALVLIFLMGRRYLRTRKAMPALLIVVLSVIIVLAQLYVLFLKVPATILYDMNILRPDSLSFPDHRAANREGLLALGGDLSVARLLLAYRSGIFPWTDEPLTWWSPDPRAIFEINSFRPPKRLELKLRQKQFDLTLDRDFHSVIRACAEPAQGRESTWISGRFIEAYAELHRQGHAHSIEAWRNGRLVGGIYGVAINGFFAGESMFHRETDASKIALCHLMDHLRTQKFDLFDTQVLSPLTARLGAIEIRRHDYLKRLAAALHTPTCF